MSSKNCKIIGPLNLICENKEINELTQNVPCILCDKIFQFPKEKDDCLTHLYLTHRIVVADVEDIFILDEYLIYWSKRINENNLKEFCTSILMDQLPDGTPSSNEKYFLLSDILPEDYELRSNLYTKRLEEVLSRHQFERTDTKFKRGCLFCRDDIYPKTRYAYLEHLFTKHFLQLGKPSNLVFIDELIDLIENKMDNLICLFCEKIFKDRSTLKEHMRKKGHKRINPDNKNYDKFFLVNYKNFKPTKQNQQQKNKNHKDKKFKHFNSLKESKKANEENSDGVFHTDDSDSDWSDWEGEKQPIICLFCPIMVTEFDKIIDHMKNEHEFNFNIQVENLNFYQKIKIVNYIRRCMHTLECVTCDKKFETSNELQNHLKELKHYGIGEIGKWNQPEYFFPTYEDDSFLCFLEDNIEDDDGTISDESGTIVYPEESKLTINPEAEKLSKEHFLYNE